MRQPQLIIILLFGIGNLSHKVHANENVPLAFPRVMNNSSTCEAYLRYLPIYGLERQPDETHEAIARETLERFKKGDLRIYQERPDLRLGSFMSTEKNEQEHARVAARIDGLLTDSRAKEKLFLVLDGEERIANFTHDILQYSDQVHQKILGDNFIKLKMTLSAFFLATLAYHPAALVSSPTAILINGATFHLMPYIPTAFRRLTQKLPRQLAEFNADHKSWIYSSTTLNVSAKFKEASITAAKGDPDISAQALAQDYESVGSRFFELFIPTLLLPLALPTLAISQKILNQPVDLSVFLKPTYELAPYRRSYITLDHLYMWDADSQKPILIIGLRRYDQKPKLPKQKKQNETETSWANDALSAES